MTAFLLQTLMLMVPAFFIGAALACGLRQLMQPAQEVLVAPVRAQPSPVDPLPQYATRDASYAAPITAPAAQSPPVPSAPQIATPPKPATPVQQAAPASAAAGRFDDTLKARSAEASRPTGAAVAQPQAAVAAKSVEPQVRAVPPPPAGPTAAAAAGAATTARAPQPPIPAIAPVIATAERIAGAAAAMAAAAAAVTAHATAVVAKNTTAPDPQMAKQATASLVPNNALATGAAAAAAAASAAMTSREPARVGGLAPASPPAPSGVVVPPIRDAVMPAKTPAGADDLTKISIIDAALATQLGTLGVSRYNQIAAWRKADVETISQGLGFKGRIEQENWIEQAQILAGGGETFYSARRAKVGAPAPAALAPSPAAVAQTPVTVASPVVLPLTMGAAAVAPATSPKVEERAAFAQSAGTARPQPTLAVPPDRTVVMPAAISTAVPATVAAAVASVATASAIPAAAAMRPPMAPVRDSLQRIGAVNGEIEKLLTGQGVTRYSQIAGWSSNEIERFDRLLGSQGRIARENWVEQAQILAKGGDTAHSREYDRRNVDSTREQVPARPKSITEAIKANAGAVAAGVGSAVSSRADIGGLRSVRSDAYKTANDAATAAAAAAAAGIGSAKVVRSAEIDDLKRIRGIGVLIEKRLNSVGIVSYGQIADWTTVDIDRVSASLDFKGRIERENWVEQARILSAGGQTEFSRRVDRGEVETSKPKS